MWRCGAEQHVTEVHIITYSHSILVVVANTLSGRNSIAFEDNFLFKKIQRDLKLLIKLKYCTRYVLRSEFLSFSLHRLTRTAVSQRNVLTGKIQRYM